jgi:hypothetical protein
MTYDEMVALEHENWIAYLTGVVSCTSRAKVTRTGGVVTVLTGLPMEAARRRGYGAAMTARAVADGVVAGCDVAALQASEMGRPIYERLGFRTVVRYAAYVEAAQPPVHARRRADRPTSCSPWVADPRTQRRPSELRLQRPASSFLSRPSCPSGPFCPSFWPSCSLDAAVSQTAKAG